ncbi:transposase, partial [Dactylosporangium fulvum]|uniref:transposase n=1 Tax=Dactylosporangium fulvum TaxID=53359 RepID=UPI0031D1C48A
ISLHALYEADAAGNPTWSASVFSGRAAAAFAVLAGVGVALATGRRRVTRADAPGTIALLAVRALAIGAVGLVLGQLDTELNAVILAYLAVVFLVAIPLVFLPTWAVATIGVLLATAGPFGDHVLLPRLPDPLLGDPTFARVFGDPIGTLIELAFTGFYPTPAWLAYMSAGVVIGRLNLTRLRVVISLLAGGTVLAVAAHTTSWLLLHRYHGLDRIWAAQPASGISVEDTTELLKLGDDGNTPTSTWWWLAVDTPHTSAPLDLLGTTGTAVAVLGLMLLIGRARHKVTRWLSVAVLLPLSAAGGMTLTFYSAHVLFINSDFDEYNATTGCIVQLVAVVLLAVAVRYTAGRGPLEAIVTMLAARARLLAVAAAARWEARSDARAAARAANWAELWPPDESPPSTPSDATPEPSPDSAPGADADSGPAATTRSRRERRDRSRWRRFGRHRPQYDEAEPWIVSDELWQRIKPLLPAAGRTGLRRPDDRQALCAVLFVLHTRVPWEHLPAELGFGSGFACRRRLARWQARGAWQKMYEVLLAEIPGADRLAWSRTVLDARFVPAQPGGEDR